MADEFDRFLVSALAPPERLPDRRFVARVQTGIGLEERLAAERRALIASFVKQLIALIAVALAVWLIGRAPMIADGWAQAPALGLAIILALFAFLVALFSSQPGDDDVGRFAPITMLNGR